MYHITQHNFDTFLPLQYHGACSEGICPRTTILTPRINSKIVAPQLLVVGAAGENLGIMAREEALKLAHPEEGLDLIEISPAANPPVARLMSFDKYRYEVEKKEKKERQTRAKTGLKHVQISARAAKNDLLIKSRQADKFLSEGHQVEIQMRLRGREKYNRPWALERLKAFLGMITVEYKAIDAPQFGGRGMAMHIIKKQ
ncbi:MAG: translation initiation factor IF-3 [Candidatus Liptonbacteria bacterium]|nr:translation initiation factor IF-3 [Candidatus Liptonbacteria bacterium]